MEDDGPPGVPEWVVTYGDMMSLLLTFFIMLVSLSEVVADQKYRDVLQALENYMGYESVPASPPGKNFPKNVIRSRVSEDRPHNLGSPSDERNFGGVKTKAPKGDEIRVFRLPDGQAFSPSSPIEFSEGTTALSDPIHQAVAGIAHEAAGKPQKLEIRSFPEYFLSGRRITSQERLELGFQRADAIRKVLVEKGITPRRIRISVPLEELKERSELELGVNTVRRNHVEVVVLDQYTDSMIGPTDEEYLAE